LTDRLQTSVPTIFPTGLEMTLQDVSDTRSVSTASATGNSNVTAENHLSPAVFQQAQKSFHTVVTHLQGRPIPSNGKCSN